MSSPDQSSLETKSFSPSMIGWLIAVFVGLIAPLFTQDLVASQLSFIGSNSPQDTSGALLSSLTLFVCVLGYVLAIGFQILFIAKLKKLSTVFSFALTIVGPVFVWVVLPYLLILFTG